MARDNFQDKTEKATPKRRSDARKKGQVAQSREVSSVMILMSALGVFFFAGTWMFWMLSNFMSGVFRNVAQYRITDIPTTGAFLGETFEIVFFVTLPVLLAVLVSGIGSNLAQFGFLFSTEALAPKLSKLDPVNGIKRLVSLKSLVELAKSVVKIGFVGSIAYLLVKSDLERIPMLTHQSVAQIFSFIYDGSFKICFNVCHALILVAALDFAYQRWEHERNLKMTKQEVKDEHKQTEGDSKIKSRIRSMQLEIARRRMMEAVPDADVVITNPTHLAVALKFDPGKMIAPRIVAKGAGYVAERIKALAIENDVPLVENKPLARTLFKMVEIDGIIPENLYRAVAEVLAYVYRLKNAQPGPS